MALTIFPDGSWRLSDGGTAQTRVVKTYTAPDDDGPAWALYKAERSNGTLRDVEYILRVMTHGGMQPRKPPKPGSDYARTAFEARYILFKR